MLGMRRKYLVDNNSRVELRLVHYVERFYHAEYRFLDIDIEYRFLFFKWTKHHKNSSWREIVQYSSPIIIDLSSTGSPDHSFCWPSVSYSADDFKGLEYFKKVKSRIKTYGDLDSEFRLSKGLEQYKKDKEEYNRILKKSKEILNSI